MPSFMQLQSACIGRRPTSHTSTCLTASGRSVLCSLFMYTTYVCYCSGCRQACK